MSRLKLPDLTLQISVRLDLNGYMNVLVYRQEKFPWIFLFRYEVLFLQILSTPTRAHCGVKEIFV